MVLEYSVIHYAILYDWLYSSSNGVNGNDIYSI